MNETVRELNKFHRDYFLICAHVEDGSGLWKEMNGGRLGELAQFEPFRERCLGFQKVRTRDLRMTVKRIETQVGSIDCPALQEAIVTIMEGGEEAFRERKRIYQVWKQQNS